MNDADFERERERVARAVERWGDFYLPSGWQVTHRFFDGPLPHPRKPGRFLGPDVAADCTALWSYRQATIRWNLETLQDEPDDRHDAIVQHELCHVLLAGITGVGRRLLRDREEEITTLVQRTIEYAAYREPPPRPAQPLTTTDYIAAVDVARGGVPTEGT